MYRKWKLELDNKVERQTSHNCKLGATKNSIRIEIGYCEFLLELFLGQNWPLRLGSALCHSCRSYDQLQAPGCARSTVGVHSFMLSGFPSASLLCIPAGWSSCFSASRENKRRGWELLNCGDVDSRPRSCLVPDRTDQELGSFEYPFDISTQSLYSICIRAFSGLYCLSSPSKRACVLELFEPPESFPPSRSQA